MQTAYKDLLEQLQAKIPGLRWIDLDRGQIDDPEGNYTLDFPAVLISFGEIPWNSIGEKVNHGSAHITFRLAFKSYNDSNNLTPESIRETALQELGIRQDLNAALQGFSGSNFNELQHTGTMQEPREDGMLVFSETYSTMLVDNSAIKTWQEKEDIAVSIESQINV